MHILIGEDDGFLQKVYAGELEKSGYRVTAAEDGEQLLSIMRSDPPDLVLLDILMPRKNGFEVLEEMRKDASLQTIPVIMLTSMGQEEDVARAKELGVRDYFLKSDMDLDGLIFLIRTLCPPKKVRKARPKKA